MSEDGCWDVGKSRCSPRGTGHRAGYRGVRKLIPIHPARLIKPDSNIESRPRNLQDPGTKDDPSSKEACVPDLVANTLPLLVTSPRSRTTDDLTDALAHLVEDLLLRLCMDLGASDDARCGMCWREVGYTW